MNLILIASPAGGKGAVAKLLNEKYGLIGVSAGELLRGVDPETEIGKMIRDLQSKRILVSDEITNELIKNRLDKDDIRIHGVMMDGYPRRMEQVIAFEEMAKELNIVIDKVIYLKVSYETALKRTLGRRICPECKATYNILTDVNEPEKVGICDKCNVPLVKRNDDNEESLKAGIKFFNENTTKVLEFYKNKGLVVEIDANQDIEFIMNDIEKALGLGEKND